MIRGLYTAAAGMLLESRRTDVISNNLANVNTTGFKKEDVLAEAFPQMLMRRLDDPTSFPPGMPSIDQRPIIGMVGVGVAAQGTATDYTQGQVVQTGNPLDVALASEGFLVVETPRGDRYTRNGSFSLDDQGFLVTADGNYVLGEGGPIQVPQGASLQIGANGEIIVDGNLVDTLRVVNFAEPAGLVKEGDSLWMATVASGDAETIEGEMRQGFLERSNVNSINEMLDLITATRAYETNQKAVQTQDQLLGKAVNEVGRT